VEPRQFSPELNTHTTGSMAGYRTSPTPPGATPPFRQAGVVHCVGERGDGHKLMASGYEANHWVTGSERKAMV